MGSDSKDYLKFDIGITIAFVVYYLISMGTFDESYSDGYKAVSNFFLFMNLLGILLHVGLVVSDFFQNKMLVVSLRGGCIAFLIGMTATVLRLGIFSI